MALQFDDELLGNKYSVCGLVYKGINDGAPLHSWTEKVDDGRNTDEGNGCCKTDEGNTCKTEITGEKGIHYGRYFILCLLHCLL
jgi:hypothetical protein